VQARNDQVVEGLQSAYAAKVPGGSLSVFCVSNETYKKFTRKGNLDMIQASGIPALRSFCYSITAQLQLLESKFFLTSRLGSLLNSLQIWVESYQQDLAGRSVRSSKSAGDYLAEIETEVRDSSHFLQRANRRQIPGIFQRAEDGLKEIFQDQLFEFTRKRESNILRLKAFLMECLQINETTCGRVLL
jgi:hypothetical protein